MKLLQSMLFSLLMGIAIMAHAVSDEVKVDLLMVKLTSTLKAEKWADALPFFAELESMEPSLQKPLPEGFHYNYIDTLDKTGDKAKALSRADIYLNKYGKSGKYYGQVIEIMGRLQMQVEKDGKDAAERKVRKEEEAAAYKLAYDVWNKSIEKCRSKVRADLDNAVRAYGVNPTKETDQAVVTANRILEEREFVDGEDYYPRACVRRHPKPTK